MLALMTRVLAGLLAAALLAGAARAAPPPVELWRLDCGELWEGNLDEFSDTHAYVGQSKRLVVSCYLIRHGESYMLWDTGLEKSDLGKPLVRNTTESEALSVTLVDQLAKIAVRPQQISLIGISHYHFDHTGQAADFPQAKLLMGKADLALLRQPARAARAKPLAPWIGGGASVEEVEGDKDIFGDGRVVMLGLPGHTPGHHGLLVKLDEAGTVLLSGDVAHFRENLEGNGVPIYNADRADSLASMDRFRTLGRNLHATVVIQHDERDVPKLPAFPKSAR
jgi:glyoxylase-like metal-dependent hydrolase (beta-lactamase superfamily II)